MKRRLNGLGDHLAARLKKRGTKGLKLRWPRLVRKRAPERGKILATKLGFNPNSSSLGVDVTFLLFGATMVSFLTPVIAALIRKRTEDSSLQVADGPTDIEKPSEELDANA